MKAALLANESTAEGERKAEALMLYVLELDPNFTNALVRLAQWKAHSHGEFAEGIRLVERALRTDPDAAWIRDEGVMMYLGAADPAAAHDVIAGTPIELRYGEFCQALYAGDWRKAADLEFNAPKQLRDMGYEFLTVFAIQWYGSKTKEFDRAIAFLRSTYQLAVGHEFDGQHFDAALSIAVLMKQRGDAAGTKKLVTDALRVLERNAKVLASKGSFDEVYRAKLHILMGEYDLALNKLTESTHGEFAGFPPDQRFQAIEKQYRDNTAQQHRLLRELRGRGEVPQRNSAET